MGTCAGRLSTIEVFQVDLTWHHRHVDRIALAVRDVSGIQDGVGLFLQGCVNTYCF